MADRAVGIASIVRRATALTFTCAIVLGSAAFFVFFRSAALGHVEDEARAMMETALAIRTYTAEQITPELVAANPDRFLPQTVPSYAAQSVFREFAEVYPDYAYREAALNPTNPDDLATAFEADLINRLRADGVDELSGIRWIDDTPHFYLARPIVMRNEACLLCHSTPAAAPDPMIALYGADGGFGWQLGDTVAIQFLTIPVADEFSSIYELVAIFFGLLIVLFLVVSLVVTLPLQKLVIQPLRELAGIADRSSLRNDGAPLPRTGAGEIQQLSSAIDRLRTSLAKSLERGGGRGGL
ncbi:DUF3365 domain-containing protein [Rhodobacterales bacterium HKCCE2091]|nr:DUF3365 domain-containing protein [Rhodobacterales bacterium HKCCE2091]